MDKLLQPLFEMFRANMFTTKQRRSVLDVLGYCLPGAPHDHGTTPHTTTRVPKYSRRGARTFIPRQQNTEESSQQPDEGYFLYILVPKRSRWDNTCANKPWSRNAKYSERFESGIFRKVQNQRACISPVRQNGSNRTNVTKLITIAKADLMDVRSKNEFIQKTDSDKAVSVSWFP